MPKKWALTTPTSPEEVACIFAADFVATCKVEGDMENYHRWNNVLRDLAKWAKFRRYHVDFQRQANPLSQGGRVIYSQTSLL
jgi:hypothetical protein